MNDTPRCAWAGSLPRDALMVSYHDEEWGVPLHDDGALFELLTLEGAQAGLSWRTVLSRRDGYRRAFDGFDIARVAAYGEADVQRLLADPGIIRNRQKIASTIGNAWAVLAIQEEVGWFDAYVWRFVGGLTLRHRFEKLEDLPARTAESEALSKDLLRRGFRFVGPTICYAFMQSAGLVNDHVVSCFRYEPLNSS